MLRHPENAKVGQASLLRLPAFAVPACSELRSSVANFPEATNKD